MSAESDRGKIDCDGMTRQGPGRGVNTDQFLIADLQTSLRIHRTSLSPDDGSEWYGPTHGQLLSIADGIGDGPPAKRASTLVIETISRYGLECLERLHHGLSEASGGNGGEGGSALADCLTDGFRACKAGLEREAGANPELRGLGAALLVGYVYWPRLALAHAGDCRCYWYHNLRLERLTTDHTLGQRSLDEGRPPGPLGRHPSWENVLWNAVMADSRECRPDVCSQKLALGDAIVLCTDGLTDAVSEHQIAQVLRKDLSAKATCARLLQSVPDFGARDDATVVIARFRSAERYRQLLAEVAEQEVQQTESETAGAEAPGGEALQAERKDVAEPSAG